MLIKKSIVEKWYQKDSWVYKNFAYLFQNPLWTKNMPRGFSVCPYFWLSLFSFFIFRPLFVAPIKYVFLPLLKAIGKPAHVVDEWLYNIIHRTTGLGPDSYSPGLGSGLSLVVLFITAVVGAGLLIIGAKTYELYNYIDGVKAGLWCFWSGLSFITLFIIIGIHKAVTKTECKTMYYLFVWLALFIASIFLFVPSEFFHMAGHVFGSTWDFLKWSGGAIWVGISTFLGWCWIGIKWAVVWQPISALLLPWWGYLVLITVVGWFADKLFNVWEDNTTAQLQQSAPEELYARYREAWVNLFMRILFVNKNWKSGKKLHEQFPPYTDKAVVTLRWRLLREAFEQMWGKDLDKLQKKYPFVNDKGWKEIAEYEGNAEARFITMWENIDGMKDIHPLFDSGNFLEFIKLIVKTDNEVITLAESYRAEEIRKTERKEAKKISWSRVTCLKVTTAISETVQSVAGSTARGFKTIWSNTATFCAYMWMLIKAKKQGACPYITFTDKQ